MNGSLIRVAESKRFDSVIVKHKLADYVSKLGITWKEYPQVSARALL